MSLLAVLLGLVRLLTGDQLVSSGGFGAVAAAATLVLLAGVAAAALATARLLGARAPSAVRDRSLRRRAYRSAFLPQRDPDARGRRRPRAPGAAPTAA
ncbi:DUF6412 domain-containing protein [Kitasatospora sp. NPDC096147]|uniref:DUF6412 domain-containing protein n=1 Tax=Kitasatospora sp. NPDC096147 TaxID=3364093 RepID=UPI0038236FAB